MDLIIRFAAPEEIASCHAIMRAAFTETARYENPSSALRETVADYAVDIEGGGALVALEDGHPIGSVRFRVREADGHLSFSRLAVLPACRGRGTGGAMVTFLEDHARALGLTEIRADARSQQPDNRPFYLERGYRILGYSERYGIPDIRTHLAKGL
jgi:predicted N-acetyltransferase YhbS